MSSAHPSKHVMTAGSECRIRTDELGRRIWVGEPSAASTSAAEALQRIADANHESVSGVGHCSEYDGIEIYVKNLTPEIETAVAEVQQRIPKAKIILRLVKFSLADLLAVARAARQAEPGLVRVGPDSMRDGIAIGLPVTTQVSPGDNPDAHPLKTSLVSQMKSNGVPLFFAVEPQVQDAIGRLSDSPPWYMGARLLSGAGNCTLGIPMVLAGGDVALTAGHCTASTFSNNGYTVGTQKTTAYPGNADIYGDWKLIEGSSYAMIQWNGPLSSTRTLAITAAKYGGMAFGSQLCSNGSYSGTICRYFVEANYQSVQYSGVWSNYQTMCHHDGDFNGNWDDDGFIKGDSGGPMFHVNSTGTTVQSIVKGFTDPGTFSDDNIYYSTMLAGVRAWNSGIYVG